MNTLTASRVAVLILLCSLILPGGSKLEGQPTGQSDGRAESLSALNQAWDNFAEAFVETYSRHFPTFAVWAGRHEFDGQLPDWSNGGIQRTIQALHEGHKKALEFTAKELSEPRKFERDVLLWAIENDLFSLEIAGWPLRNPHYYKDMLAPAVYVNREYAPLEKRLQAYTRYARNIPPAVEQIRTNLDRPLPRVYLETGMQVYEGMATFLEKDVPGAFTSLAETDSFKGFLIANKAATRAIRELSVWMKERVPSGTSNYAVGARLFLEMLRQTDQYDMTIEDLKRMAERDLERNLTALREACSKLAPGKPIAECMALINARKPPDGSIEGARRQLGFLKAFLLEHDMASIPGMEDVIVKESPPYERSSAASCTYPGPLDKHLPTFFYVTPSDPSWTQKERQDAEPSESRLLFLSIHEVWPGHFLQYQHQSRHPSLVCRLFTSYSFQEGWAHYAEEMIWECGLLANDLETQIAMLRQAAVRDVRFLSAIGLHTENMTLEESERMFHETAFLDSKSAQREALRGTYDPEYFKYTFGKLKIRSMREEWTASRGGRKSWKEFHDTLLSHGAPPLPLARKSMGLTAVN